MHHLQGAVACHPLLAEYAPYFVPVRKDHLDLFRILQVLVTDVALPIAVNKGAGFIGHAVGHVIRTLKHRIRIHRCQLQPGFFPDFSDSRFPVILPGLNQAGRELIDKLPDRPAELTDQKDLVVLPSAEHVHRDAVGARLLSPDLEVIHTLRAAREKILPGIAGLLDR